jgi:hypothetical protein
MTPGLLRAAKGVDHEAPEGHKEEPDRSRSITWETLTWQPGFAGLVLLTTATDKTSQTSQKVLSGRCRQQNAGPPQAAARSAGVIHLCPSVPSCSSCPSWLTDLVPVWSPHSERTTHVKHPPA